MERKISETTERRLTHAIEKAASLALVQPEQDRSRLLADILLRDDVENTLAKTAAAAFNRRLTVLKFQKTADEHKAETFPLADPEQVLEYMGGTGEMPKVAAEMTVHQGPFEMTVTRYDDGTIVKTAKSAVVRPLYEDTVTYPQLENHLESMLHLHEATFSRKMGELMKMAEDVDAERADVLNDLAKVGSFEWRTLCNVFGDRLESALGGVMPEGTDFSKTASVVNPHTPVFEKVAKLLDDMDELAAFNDMMVDYKDGLMEMGKAAADMACDMRKSASPSGIAGMLIRGGVGGAMTLTNAAEAIRRAANDALAQGYDTAAKLNRAGTDVDVSPARVLESDFLLKDRYRDRLRAWSDLSADPVLAQYDPAELFTVTQRAMDTVPALERPDRREELRIYVSQMMPQHGRLSTADLAALATTERGLASSPKSVAHEALEETKKLDKEKAPEAPSEVTSVFSMVNAPKLTPKDWLSDATNENIRAGEAEKKEDKEKAEAAKKLTDADEQKAKDNAAEAEKRQKALVDAAEQRKKALVAFMSKMNIKPVYGPDNTIGFTQMSPGKNPVAVRDLTADQVRELFEDYQTKMGQI